MNLNFYFSQHLKPLLFILIGSASFFGSVGYSQIISQYVETNSGSTPKGIEIWNNTGVDIIFSATNNLQVYQGTTGGGMYCNCCNKYYFWYFRGREIVDNWNSRYS